MRKYLALIKGGFLEGIAYKEKFPDPVCWQILYRL